LRVKLAHLDNWNKRRSAIAARYRQGLAGCGMTLPYVPDWAEPVWHLYVAQHPQRDALQKHLGDTGVSTLIHYPIPPHLQQAYSEAGYMPGQFPIAEQIANQCLSLPMGPHLGAQDAIDVIAACKSTTGTSSKGNAQ
jgi:dTDP-4-amino-4,6-dideoxygalactose transaminase